MSGIDFYTALGRLLSDPALLALFRRDPQAALSKSGIDAAAFGDWRGIDGDDLAAQAQTLLNKRWHEVRQLLPLTLADLGEIACEHFMRYAVGYWPAGYQRHWDDASHFCRYLRTLRLPVRRAEFNRLQFCLRKRRLAIHVVRHTSACSFLPHAVQILYRFGKQVRETRFYFASR